MAKKDDKKKLELPKVGQLIRVHNRTGREGYRRGGIGHSTAPTDHPAETFDDEQLQQLLDDPNIDVSYVDAPKEEKAA